MNSAPFLKLNSFFPLSSRCFPLPTRFLLTRPLTRSPPRSSNGRPDCLAAEAEVPGLSPPLKEGKKRARLPPQSQMHDGPTDILPGPSLSGTSRGQRKSIPLRDYTQRLHSPSESERRRGEPVQPPMASSSGPSGSPKSARVQTWLQWDG